MIQADILDL